MEDIKVEKRDGRIEGFVMGKISSGVVKSGGTQEQADSISKEVETWARGVAAGGVIKTSDIGAKVVELLTAVNPEAGKAFNDYMNRPR